MMQSLTNRGGGVRTANMDKEAIMCMRGQLSELMVDTAPEIYRKFIYARTDNKPVLYVRLQMTPNRCLRSALIFYKKLVEDLTSDAFEINPYIPCVANNIVNGKQFTVTCHIDDLKISHGEEKEVTKAIDWLKSIYGEDMSVSRAKKHDYLGMDLNFTVPGEVKVTMVEYLEGFIR
jgi:hypothetical protein